MVAPCSDIHVTFDITNIGTMPSDHVVMVFLATPNATVPSPRIRLAAFDRLQAVPAHGGRRTVALSIKPEWHAVVKDNGAAYHPDLLIEAGSVELWVAPTPPTFSATPNTTVLVTGDSALKSCGG